MIRHTLSPFASAVDEVDPEEEAGQTSHWQRHRQAGGARSPPEQEAPRRRSRAWWTWKHNETQRNSGMIILLHVSGGATKKNIG